MSFKNFLCGQINVQYSVHVETNNLHAQYQSSYRTNYSCETALMKITNDIEQNLNSDENTVLVLLDSSAAFDTVDHEILLEKLENEFKITGKALMLIASYLNNREFTTLVNTAESRPKQVNCGVPQESLFGPLLYILYTKGIEKIVLRHNLKVHMYADDVQIFLW